MPPPPPPVETDPAPKVDGDVTDEWVNGAHVLIKRIPGAETTSTQLFIQGGVRNWSKADAGIEQLAIATATSGGTERMNKDAFTKKLGELGSSISGGASNDFSTIAGWSLLPNWEETYAILVDTFRRPALPQMQIEIVRAQMLANLKREQDNPDSKLGYLVHMGIYRSHPYEHRAIGTLETVAALQRDQLVAHLSKLRQSSRLLLVVVGDLDTQRVLDATRRLLGDLPRGSYRPSPLPAWKTDKASISLVEQQLPTSYIQAVFPGPGWRDPEFPVALVGMSTLGHRVFEEVRTKRNLSYAPAAYFAFDAELTYGVLYVTATDPKTTMKVMLDAAKHLRDEAISAKELDGTKATLLTRLLMEREAPSDQARSLAMHQILGGDWHLDRTLAERVRAVTPAQVQTWAAKNVTRLRTFVIGDKSKALDQPLLEQF